MLLHQTMNGLAALLLDAAERRMDGKKTLVQVVDLLEKQMEEKGLSAEQAQIEAFYANTRK